MAERLEFVWGNFSEGFFSRKEMSKRMAEVTIVRCACRDPYVGLTLYV